LVRYDAARNRNQGFLETVSQTGRFKDTDFFLRIISKRQRDANPQRAADWPRLFRSDMRNGCIFQQRIPQNDAFKATPP
jgi:hypothetical protein